jgi:uncharacterized protein (UPF0264 family)
LLPVIVSDTRNSIKTISNVTAPPVLSPRLLVSVRNAAEAEAALAGGCDVLDVKEPARGPLGMADFATIAEVVARVQDLKSSVPISAALGEVVEWEEKRPMLRLPVPVTYQKLGTAGLGTDANWALRFAKLKQQCATDGRTTPRGREPEPEKWIAVGYADWEEARAPCPEDVIAGARECGCAGVLIDTFSKEHGGLFNWLRPARLESVAARARRNGLEFALAGRLQVNDLPRLARVVPDIVGIRSAACRAGIRTGEIDSAAVRRFRDALQATCCAHSAASRPVHPGGVGAAWHS